MAVVAVRLVRTRAASAQGDSRLFRDQTAVSIHETDPAAHVQRPEVPGTNGRHLVGLLLREVASCLVLESTGRTQADGRGDALRVGRVDLDPWPPSHIEDFGKLLEALCDMSALARIPEHRQFLTLVDARWAFGTRNARLLRLFGLISHCPTIVFRSTENTIMVSMGGEERHGVSFTNLDEPLFKDAGVTKRDLVDYLDAIADLIVPELAGRPLSVIRTVRGQAPFMQKNLPKYTPDWVESVTWWSESSKRDVRYALCNDRRTLLWFANQRAVEYHPTLVRADAWDHVSYLVLDIDPPSEEAFDAGVEAALLVRQVLDGAGLEAAVKTSGAKGIHVFVPVTDKLSIEDASAATRALAARAERLDPDLATTAFVREEREGKVFVDSTRGGGATVVAAYSPRIRPGVPVSFPVSWDDLKSVKPQDFTITSAAETLGGRNPWRDSMPKAQTPDSALIEEGRAIPIARVKAMHEGKRRAKKERDKKAD